jgi:hypothetical protein
MTTTNLAGTRVNTEISQSAFMASHRVTGGEEKSALYGLEYDRAVPRDVLEGKVLVAVAGDLFVLQSGPYPQPVVHLSEESGILRIVGLAGEQGS